MVREGAILARGDDRGEGGVLGAQLSHPLLGREHDLALGPPHHRALEHPLVGLVGEPRGLGDRRLLALVLAAAQPLHQPSRGDQLDALGGRPLELPQAPDARVGVVVPDPAVKTVRRADDQLAVRGRPFEVTRHLAAGALHVAEVGDEAALALADQGQPAGAAEPREPAQVGDRVAARVARSHEVTDQQQVELPLGHQRGEPVGASRAHLASSAFSISSASR